MPCFIPLAIRPGLLYRNEHSAHPTAIWGWGPQTVELPPGGSWFGMVTTAGAKLELGYGEIPLRRGMFFVSNAGGQIAGGAGLLIWVSGYCGLAQIGGPLEASGRLRYIDGCSDTLWVSPPRLGEPCLNHLHIPPGTDQTRHTHPSDRIGVILGGRGECRTPDGIHPLAPGMGWIIPAGSPHSFFTTDQPLDVVAWHPDSDFGPTDQNHPMINRTQIPLP